MWVGFGWEQKNGSYPISVHTPFIVPLVEPGHNTQSIPSHNYNNNNNNNIHNIMTGDNTGS